MTSVVTDKTKKEGAISINLEHELGIVGEQEENLEPKPWLINSLWSIGWPDPFPDEFSGIEQDFLRNNDDLVYHKSRYTEDQSPSIIYIPSKIVMVKLMRACMGVTSNEQLWIYETQNDLR